MFAGEVFWRAGQAASEALESFIETERENESVPQISGTLVELLKRCFQHNPEDRPKDMQEITRKLKEIYQDTVNQEYNREEPKPAELLADGLNNKAVSMLDLGRKEDAEKLYEEALKADPHHPEATYNRGLLLWRSGQMTDDELIRELEEVRTTHTEDWVDEYLLGLVHIERGDAESAVKVLKQVSQQASENNNIRLALKTAQSGLKSWSRCLDILGSHKGRIDVVAISPNSRLALSATYGGERLRMWEIATGKCLIDFNESANSAMYSNDGKYVLSARKWYVESDSSNALAAIIESTNLSIKLWESTHIITAYNIWMQTQINPCLTFFYKVLFLSFCFKEISPWAFDCQVHIPVLVINFINQAHTACSVYMFDLIEIKDSLSFFPLDGYILLFPLNCR